MDEALKVEPPRLDLGLDIGTGAFSTPEAPPSWAMRDPEPVFEGFNSDLSTPPPAPASAEEGFDVELRAFDDEAYKTNLGYTKEQTDTWREPRFAYPTENQTSDAFQKIARSVDSPLSDRITAVGEFYDDTMSGLIKNAPNASRRAKGAGKLEADYGAAKSDLFHQFAHQRIKELFPDHTERTGFIEELNRKGFPSLQNSESPKHKAAYTDLTQGFDKLLPAREMFKGGEISNKDGTKIAEFNTNRLNNGNTVISLRFPSVDANGNPGLFDKDNILEMPYPTADDVSAEVKKIRDEAAKAKEMSDSFSKPDNTSMMTSSDAVERRGMAMVRQSESLAFKQDAERLTAEANSLAMGGPDALLERRIEEKIRTDKNLLSQIYSPGFMQEAGTALDKFIISAAATADSTPYWKEFTAGLTGALGKGAEAIGLDPTEYGLYEGGSVVSRAPDVIKTIDETRPGMAQTQFEGGMANNVMLGAVENWPQIAAQTAMIAAAGGPAMLFGRLPGMLAARTASMAPIAVTVPGQGMVEVEGRAQDIEGGYNAQIRSLELAYQKLDSIKEVADLSKQIAQVETEFPDSPELNDMRNELALLKQAKAVEIETKIAGLREKSKAEAIKMRDKAVGYSLTNLAIELGSEMIFPNSQVRLAKGIGKAKGVITDIGKEGFEEPAAGFGQDLFANPILGEFNHPLDPEKRITEGLVGGIMAGGQVTAQKLVNRGMFGSQEQRESKAASKTAAKTIALVQGIQGGTAPAPLDTKSEFVDGPLGVQTKNPHYVSQDSNGKWGIADDEWKAKAAAVGLPTEFDTEDEAAAMAQTRYQNLFKESVERTVGGDATERRNAIMASADIILKMASVTGAGNMGYTAEDLFRMIVVQGVPQNNRPKDMPGKNPWVTASNIPAPAAPTPVKGSPPVTGTGTPPATGTPPVTGTPPATGTGTATPPVTDTGAGTPPVTDTGKGLTPSPDTVSNPWTTATVPLPVNPPAVAPPDSGVAPTEAGGAAPTMTPDEEIRSLNTQLGGLTTQLYDLIEESKKLMDSGAGLEELMAVAEKRNAISEEQKALSTRLQELMGAKGKVVPAVDVSTAKPTNTIPSVDDSNAAIKKDAEDQEDANTKVQDGVDSNNVETDQEENNKKAGVPEIEVVLESPDNGFAKTVGAKVAETLKHPMVQRLYALGKAKVVVGTVAQIQAKYKVDVYGARGMASMTQDANGDLITTVYINLDSPGIMDGLDMTVIHEGVHAVEFTFRMTKEGWRLYQEALKLFKDGKIKKSLDTQMRAEYLNWDGLNAEGKFAETVRAIMSGRIFGDNLTAGNPTTSNSGAFTKYIKAFVKYINKLFSDGPPSGALAAYVRNLENFINESNVDPSLDTTQAAPNAVPQPMAAAESTADIIEETTKAAVIPGRRVGTSSPTSAKADTKGADPDHNVTLERLKQEKPEFYRRNAVLLGAYPIVANVGGKAFAKMRKDLISLYEVSAKLVTQREENNAIRSQIGKIITNAAKDQATAEGRPRSEVKSASKEQIDDFIANPTKGNASIAKKAASSQAALDKAIGREKALKDMTSDEVTKLSRDPSKFSMEEAEAVYDSYIEQTQKNLEMLIQLMPPSIRKVAKLWYDGANRIANAFAGNYDITVEQSAAVLAVFSPQKDWFMNVSLANRMMDVWKNKQDHIWDADMSTQFRKRMGEPQIKMVKGPDGTLIESRKDKPSDEDLEKNIRGEMLNPEGYIYVGGAKPVGFDEDGNRIWENFTSESKAQQRKTAEDFIKKAQGKLSLSQMTDLEQGWFIRMYSETYHPETYEVVGPDGSFGNKAKTGDGKRDLRIAWGGYSTIAKAISVMENGDQSAISNALGSQHKVRSFYNNIVDPSEATTLGDTNLYGDVTMDTHAVAALLLLPLSGATREVSQNFGGGGASSDSVAGLNGMYAANAEAYRRAAKDFKLLPREVQSITWEAVRMLFPASWKSNKKNVAAARSIWNDYANGDITADTARSRIWELSPASAGPTKRDGTDGNRVGLAAAKRNGRGVGSPEWWEAVVPGGKVGSGQGELTNKGWTPEIGGFRDGRGRRRRDAGRANRGGNNPSLLAQTSERISDWSKSPPIIEPQGQTEGSERPKNVVGKWDKKQASLKQGSAEWYIAQYALNSVESDKRYPSLEEAWRREKGGAYDWAESIKDYRVQRDTQAEIKKSPDAVPAWFEDLFWDQITPSIEPQGQTESKGMDWREIRITPAERKFLSSLGKAEFEDMLGRRELGEPFEVYSGYIRILPEYIEPLAQYIETISAEKAGDRGRIPPSFSNDEFTKRLRAQAETQEDSSTPSIARQSDSGYIAAVERGDSGNDSLTQLLRDAPEGGRKAVVDAWVQRNPKAATELQWMVDEAAQRAGYDVEGFHGTNSPEFKEFTDSPMFGSAWFFSDGKEYPAQRGSRVMAVRLKPGKQKIVKIPTNKPWSVPSYEKGILDAARSQGFDSVKLEAVPPLWMRAILPMIGLKAEVSGYTNATVVFNPNQIKSADPVTYDETGEIIPPSERFDPTTPSIMRQTEAGTEADFEIPGWVNAIYKNSLNPSIAPVAAVMNFTEASTFVDVIHQFTHVLSILQVYVDPANQAAGKRTLLESMLGSKFLSLYNFATQDGRIDPSTPEGFRSYLERISEGMVRFLADGDVPSTADKKLVDGFTIMRDGLKKVIASYQATGIPFGVSLPDREALTDDVLNAYQEIMFNIWVSEKRSELPPETLSDMEAANAMHLASLDQLNMALPANLYQPAQTVAFKELSPMVAVANLLIAQKNKGISPKSFSDFQAMIDPSNPLAQLTEGQLQIVYQVASISAPNPTEMAIHDKIKALMAVPLTTLAADAKVTTDLIQEAIDIETDPVAKAKLETIIYQADTANTHAQLAAAQARAAHAIASSVAARNRKVADKMRSMMAGYRAGKADSSIQKLGEEVKRVFAIYAKSAKLKKGTKAMVRQMIDGATLMQKGKISPADFMALIAGATQAVEQDLYAASVIAFNKGVVTGTKATVADVRRRAKMLQDLVIAELATIKAPTKPVVKAVLKALNGVTSTRKLVKAANLIAKSFSSRRTREAYSKAKKLAESTKANINNGMFGVAGSHVATLAGVKTSQIPQTMLGTYLSLVSYLGQKSKEIVIDPTILGAIDLWNSTFEAHIIANPPVGRGVSAGAASARAAAEAAKKAQALIDYDAARKTVSRDAFVDAYTKLYGKTKEQALSALETLEKWLPFLESAESVDLDHLKSNQINGLISSFQAFNNGIIQSQLILAGQEIATRETHETLLPVIQQAVRHVLGADPSITLAGITPNELESRSKSIASTILLFAHSGKYSKEDFRKTLQKVGLSHFDTLFGTVSSMAELIVSPLTKLHFEGEIRKQRMLEAGNLYVDAKDHESEIAIKPEMLEAMKKSGLLDVSLWQGNTSFFAPVAAAVGKIGRILVPPARRHYRREAISRILGIAMIQRQREANGWSDPNAATIDDNYILWLTTSKPGDVSSEYGRREGVRQQRAAAALISALNGAAPTWANIEKLMSAKNLEAIKNADTVFEQTGETVHYLNMMDESKPLRTFEKYFPINDMSGKTADLSSGAKLASRSTMPQPGSISTQAGSRNQRTDKSLKLVDADFFGVIKSHVAEVTGDAAMSPFLNRMNEAMNRIRRSGVVGGVGSSIVEDFQDQLLDHGNRIAQSIFFDQDIATTLFAVIGSKFKEVPLAKLERPFTEGPASAIRAFIANPSVTLAGMKRFWTGTGGFADKLMFELGSNIAIRQGSMTLEMQLSNLNATFAGMLNSDFRLPSPISNIKGAWDAGSKMPTGKGVFGWVQTNRTSRAIKGFTQVLVTAGETYIARPFWYGTFTQSLEQQSGIPWSEDNYTNGAYTQEQISRAQALAETAVSRKFAESTPGTQPTIGLEKLDSADSKLEALWRYFNYAFTSYSGAQTRDLKASMQALVDGNAAGYDRRDALANSASIIASYALNTILVSSIAAAVGAALSSGNPEEDKRRKRRRDDFFRTAAGQGLEGDAEAFYMKMLARSLFASVMGDRPLLQRMGAAIVLEGGNYLAGQGTTWNGAYDPYKDNVTFELPPSVNNALIGVTSDLTGNDRRLRGDQDTNVTNISSAYQFFGLLAYGVEMGQSALGSAQNIYADKVKGNPVDSSASMDNLAMFGLLSINMLPASGNAFAASRPREAAANSAYASRNENRDKRTAEKEARTAVDDGLVTERRERVAALGDNIAEHFDETLRKWGTAKAEMNQYEDDAQNEIMTKALREMMTIESDKMNETFTRSYREMEALGMGRDFLRSVVRMRHAGFSTMPALTKGSEEANKLRDFEESKFTDGISVYGDYYHQSRIMKPSLK
jgi:hypothetical protein